MTTPTLSFACYSNDPTPTPMSNSVSIDIIAPFGFSIANSVFVVSHVGPEWVTYCVDLSNWAGLTGIRLRFRGNSQAGLGFDHDIAIDDIAVVDAAGGAGTGVGPVPGRAMLDINRARTGNGLTLDCGLPGPYFSTADADGRLNITIDGAAAQPFILLAGPLTVGVANLPPIGQFDVGMFNPNPPFTPVATIVFDGTNPPLGSLFFMTDANGIWELGMDLPSLSPGVLTAFQAVVFTGDAQVAQTSNAVEVTIL